VRTSRLRTLLVELLNLAEPLQQLAVARLHQLVSLVCAGHVRALEAVHEPARALRVPRAVPAPFVLLANSRYFALNLRRAAGLSATSSAAPCSSASPSSSTNSTSSSLPGSTSSLSSLLRTIADTEWTAHCRL